MDWDSITDSPAGDFRKQRAEARERVKQEAQLEDARGLLRMPLSIGSSYHIYTGAQFDIYNVLQVIMDHHGTVDSFSLLAWTLGAYQLKDLIARFDAGKIQAIDIHTGLSWGSGDHNLAHLKEAANERGWGWKQSHTHAKLYRIKAGTFHYSIQSSGNLNPNPNGEQVVIHLDRVIYQHFE